MPNQTKMSIGTSLCPLDGRYANQLSDIANIFSELHLILLRLTIEIEWLKTLSSEPKIKELKPLNSKNITSLHNIIAKFTVNDINRIKEIEKETNHDVKAIEYFLKEKLNTDNQLKSYKEFIHFACTSDDTNNLCYALMLDKARNKAILPTMRQIITTLGKMASDYAKIPMLARTHGQPATPTTLGKEFASFAYRLTRQYDYLFIAPILGKLNGAVGNYNAHIAAYPEIDWEKISQKFVEDLGLTFNPYTTQIEPHDWIAEYCDIMARFNTILIGFCRDIWHYIAIGYLKQKPKANEIGSSTMPHKINPIDFENAEGNLGLANALLNHFSAKLPISRLQRDLSDSTVMRNLGTAIGYSVLAYRSLIKGLAKITANHETIKKDLNNHWEILAEPIQTIMRRYGKDSPYEQLKNLTRGQAINQKTIHAFIKKLKLPKNVKQKLLKLKPENYLGKAQELAKNVITIIK